MAEWMYPQGQCTPAQKAYAEGPSLEKLQVPDGTVRSSIDLISHRVEQIENRLGELFGHLRPILIDATPPSPSNISNKPNPFRPCDLNFKLSDIAAKLENIITALEEVNGRVSL